MQIVIDIDEKTYEQLKFLTEQGFGTVIDEVVANGIPLSKGHGRLIDARQLLTVTDYDGENEKTYIPYDEIEKAPAIIEADKEG